MKISRRQNSTREINATLKYIHHQVLKKTPNQEGLVTNFSKIKGRIQTKMST